MHSSVHCSTIYNRKDIETNEMSIDRWMGKQDAVHIYSGILLSHKKEQNNAICSDVDREIVILSEITQRKINIIWYCLYVKSKK